MAENNEKKGNNWLLMLALGIIAFVIQKAFEPPVIVWLGFVVLAGLYGLVKNFITKYKGEEMK